MKRILFVFDSCRYLVKKSSSIGKFKLNQFPNKEWNIQLQTNVKNCHCVVLGTITPPDSNLFLFLLLCHTLKKEKAASITVILPYLAYSRHDHNEHQKSFTTAMLGGFFKYSGITKLITYDIHSRAAKKLFPLQVISLSPAKVFADEIIKAGLQNASLIAPDEGAIVRCKEVAYALGKPINIAFMKKKRTEKNVTHQSLQGKVNDEVIIIDDMLDTGGTLISCCKKLSKLEVKSIYIMVTHGLFTGNKWKKLWKLGVKKIYCTNTLPLNIQNSKIVVIPIATFSI